MKRFALVTSVLCALVGCNSDAEITSTGSSGTGTGTGNGSGTGTGSGTSGNGTGNFTFKPGGAGGAGGSGAGSTGSGTNGNPTMDKNCGFQNYNLQRVPPELLLVLDRSGSMKETPKGVTGTKWVNVSQAVDETVMKTAAAVSWGLKTFPGPTTCSVPDGVDVAVAANNFTGMDGAIQMTQPQGDGTPTAAAISKSVEYLKTLTTKNPKYIVLATDGQPNCKGGNSGSADDPGAVQAVAAAAAAGFHTFVVGIATQGTTANTTLNMMATAGMEPRNGDPKYYAIASRQELVDALAVITGRIASCSFPLEKAPPSPDDVAVNINGTRIQRDKTHMSGWDYNGGTSIQVYGALCDMLKAGTVDKVDIIYGCPGVLIP